MKATLEAQEEARKSNALVGRLLAKTQAWQHERFLLREAISKAQGALHRGDATSARRLLDEALTIRE